MGYMRHHAIIVTTWDLDLIRHARNEATNIFGADAVTGLVDASTNGYRTFFVGPDGSKEGWDESDQGDQRRDRFVHWLNAQRAEDGSSWLDWAEIQYGDDDGDNRVLRHNDESLEWHEASGVL